MYRRCKFSAQFLCYITVEDLHHLFNYVLVQIFVQILDEKQQLQVFQQYFHLKGLLGWKMFQLEYRGWADRFEPELGHLIIEIVGIIS